mmetsp:Transcript_10505/g.12041  ORF Transcript_10505/g.12041 Transcript_10505/m.12041 type:complete len:370 (-) Transcript_10505:132-1241(-)|eukprot:CAMPEP_0194136564 /NCGR_PEP_ID=MMETSP0152-20130528/6576_1 /TAXON_ID=1049557 /ORGANISM="Thalassiothrix antarctica, Strain L6-D1" /LENGTH=369 /DNA_ID=CAMNT_0038833279 /DNA_START=76 /DNA_END=1185 /DNA_ORIENTATION=+
MKFLSQSIELFLISALSSSEAFSSQKLVSHSRKFQQQTGLFGLSEWRDADYSSSSYTAAEDRIESEESLSAASSPAASSSAASLAFSMMKEEDDDINSQMSVPVRELSILIRDSEEVTLLGEEKYFQFVTDEEVEVFGNALHEHNGIFGIGLVRTDDEEEHDEIIDVLPLFEIQEYTFLDQKFGIMCKAVNVGRATIQDMLMIYDENEDTDENKCITALCQEKFDINSENIVLANEVAGVVEELIADISYAEELAEEADRIEEDEVEDEGYDRVPKTRLERFRKACVTTFHADTQGYISSSASYNSDKHPYSWKELSAMSWAAFATNEDLRSDSHYRLNALDMDCTINRLKLAMYWLSDVQAEFTEDIV